MNQNPVLNAGLACIGIDIVLRLIVLWYWLYSPENTPDLPFIYKGIKYPEIQASILIVGIIIVSASINPAWRTQRSYSILSVSCLITAIMVFLVGFFYSNNVGGSAGGFLAASLSFDWLRKSWK